MRILPYLVALPLLLLTACLKDECRDTIRYQAYDPVYITAGEWRTDDFTFAPSVEVCEPTGFYVYGDYLFIVDRNAGMHIYDNRDNDSPQAVSFLPIPGGQGLAVRNDILYVNQYTDLLAFDLSDPSAPRFLHRSEDVFEATSVFAAQLGGGQFIVEYTPSTQTYEMSCEDARFGFPTFWMEDQMFVNDMLAFNQFSSPQTGGASADVVGMGGSLARFTIANGSLFTVDDYTLRTFSLSDPARPELVTSTELGWGIETIFPYKDQLYIGSTTGMHIYDVSSPRAPEHLSTFEHVLSCDPVVVQNDIAYVTMWGGSDCGSQTDQLSIIDVSDPRQPLELESVPMEQSHGLGVSGDRLYLCAGTLGIKVFELTAEGRLGKLLSTRQDFNARDVIVRGDRQELIVFGWEQAGIRQYDYTASGELTAVSALSVCPQPL
ncbi:hypothetical protein LEM8419_02920 [Neolewinella maritima]|uniref:LVIVD repeat-containing protein n=1 Tax=Neolewinella maritima TaxID=1383882 RepID=A0ABN8FCE1_9BACT|nr:hypothetical protein [Neolewinella maritima]CAH1002005.1 hypothetical protein LEM8419_02920 [Neolewinella maritima]